jgi:uncharacterized protein YndB with AHSA1/START domain
MSKRITVIAEINSDIKSVWKCMTEPEHIINWNFASDDWHCPKATNDLKVGGHFSYTMASKDGQQSFDFEGRFDEVIINSNLSYTIADGRKVDILFEGFGNVVLVTEKFEPETVHSEELQKAGWQAILDNFKKYVESI